ncbi:MAG: hypothetical protein EHM51_00520 [Geobacter sp.]|nr:MAG: hypothetical protein EHM51_00520 [Geobacter sp.]
MKKMENYREQLEAQLKEWKATIESLEAKAAKTTAETRAEFTKEIEELRRKKVVVKEKLNELQKVSGETWDTMKVGVEKAVDELKSALDRVISRFK